MQPKGRQESLIDTYTQLLPEWLRMRCCVHPSAPVGGTTFLKSANFSRRYFLPDTQCHHSFSGEVTWGWQVRLLRFSPREASMKYTAWNQSCRSLKVHPNYIEVCGSQVSLASNLLWLDLSRQASSKDSKVPPLINRSVPEEWVTSSSFHAVAHHTNYKNWVKCRKYD